MEHCAECGAETPVEELDAKPGPGYWAPDQLAAAADAGVDFDRMECRKCYGPGYQSQNTN